MTKAGSKNVQTTEELAIHQKDADKAEPWISEKEMGMNTLKFVNHITSPFILFFATLENFSNS